MTKTDAKDIRPVVVMPVYRLPLLPDDELSLQYLNRNLEKHDKVLCVPESLNLNSSELLRGYECMRFPDYYFKSTHSYSRLLMSHSFYEAFRSWSHLLVYQLDCLVFNDELIEWCSKDYDYIGSPWVNKYFLDNPSDGLWRVGNGGFSLRNIQSFLEILNTQVYSGSLYADGGPRPWRASTPESELGAYSQFLPLSFQPKVDRRYISTINEECKSYIFNEDAFWSFEAPKVNAHFKVMSPSDALAFAFEMSPAWCFIENGGKLPFGCHAWNKYNRAFWDSIINGVAYQPVELHASTDQSLSSESPDEIMVILRNQESCMTDQKKYICELEGICSERLNIIQELNIICSERLEEMERIKTREARLAEQISGFIKSPVKSALKLILSG